MGLLIPGILFRAVHFEPGQDAVFVFVALSAGRRTVPRIPPIPPVAPTDKMMRLEGRLIVADRAGPRGVLHNYTPPEAVKDGYERVWSVAFHLNSPSWPIFQRFLNLTMLSFPSTISFKHKCANKAGSRTNKGSCPPTCSSLVIPVSASAMRYSAWFFM